MSTLGLLDGLAEGVEGLALLLLLLLLLLLMRAEDLVDWRVALVDGMIQMCLRTAGSSDLADER